MPSIATFQIFQLGNEERNKTCVLRVVQNVSIGVETNDAMLMTPFSGVKEWRAYEENVREIRTVLADARNLKNAGIITKEGYVSRVAARWYPLSLTFIGEWGTEMVPFDIRWAINDIEEHALAIRQTSWPSHILYIDNKPLEEQGTIS